MSIVNDPLRNNEKILEELASEKKPKPKDPFKEERHEIVNDEQPGEYSSDAPKKPKKP
jgi:hypothetical protein